MTMNEKLNYVLCPSDIHVEIENTDLLGIVADVSDCGATAVLLLKLFHHLQGAAHDQY